MFSSKSRTILWSNSKGSKRFLSKLSYWNQASNEPLLKQTIGALAVQAAEKFPDRPALVSKHENSTVTFPELLRNADKLAAAFAKANLRKGDCVGVWSQNSIRWVETWLACLRAGLMIVQLNPSYVADELKYSVNKVGIKFIVCPEIQGQQNYYEVLNEIDDGIRSGDGPSLKLRSMPSLRGIVALSERNLRGTYSYDEFLDGIGEREFKMVRQIGEGIHHKDPSIVMFTSGSTGKPKAAVLTHYNLTNNSFTLGNNLKLHSKHHKFLVQTPFFHAFGTVGVIMQSLHFGATMVLSDVGYNAEKNLEAIQSERCTVLFGTPTMHLDLINLQRKRNLDLSSLEICGFGAAPITSSMVKSVYDVFKVKHAVHLYGMTECTALVFHTKVTDTVETVSTTVGRPVDHVSVKVCDKDGNVVPFGTPGELYVKGYSTMLHYCNDEEKTRETLTTDGWVKTGDKFVLFEDGTGKIIGRIKDIIIRGGENIDPKEIEELLSSHPNILDCHVVGIPHKRLGEEVCACVRLKHGSTISQEEISKFCDKKIAHYKIPSKVHVATEFPKTATGKVPKYMIVEEILKLNS